MDNITIDSLAWYRPETISHDIKARFKTLVLFLQDNGLTQKALLPPSDEIPPDFKLSSGDLTEEGNEFIRFAYTKWVQRVDRGASPTDQKYLEQALRKMRS